MTTRSDRVLEELLVLRSQSGDRAAFDRLVELWHPRLLRLARRLTRSDAADGVVQEAWLAIVRGLSKLKDPALFGPWALRIVSFKSADWVRGRQRGRKLRAEVAAEPSAEAVEADPDDEASEPADDLARLRGRLGKLPARQRVVLEMHYLEELPVARIAAVLGIPAGTVKSRLFHARKQLRASLEEAK